jgi:hypothetical protein
MGIIKCFQQNCCKMIIRDLCKRAHMYVNGSLVLVITDIVQLLPTFVSAKDNFFEWLVIIQPTYKIPLQNTSTVLTAFKNTYQWGFFKSSQSSLHLLGRVLYTMLQYSHTNLSTHQEASSLRLVQINFLKVKLIYGSKLFLPENC